MLRLIACRCLDKAAITSEGGPLVTLTEVEESKAFFGILPLFLCICIYQMTYVSALRAALRVQTVQCM
jgi:hypothetical protein